MDDRTPSPIQRAGGQRRFILAMFLLFAGFFAYISFCSPLVLDDLEFAALPIGSFRALMNQCLYYGNGRLLGNVLSMTLSNNLILRVIVKAATVSSIIVLLPAALGLSGRYAYPLSFLLLTGLKPSLFAEVYGWTSGFANYVPPVLCMLLCVVWVNPLRLDMEAKRPFPRILLILFVGFCGQLFVEHATIVSIALAGMLVFAVYRCRTGSRPLAAAYLVSTLAGGTAMLLLPKIFSMAGNRAEGYRHVTVGKEALYTMARHTIGFSNLYNGYVFLICALGAVGLFWLCFNGKAAPKSKSFSNVCAAVLGGFPAYAVLNLFCRDSNWYGEYTLIIHLFSLALLALFLACFVLVVYQGRAERFRTHILLCVGLAVFSLAPLLIVSLFRERCVYLSYVLFAAAVLMGSERIFRNFRAPVGAAAIRALSALSVVLSLCLGLAFFNIHNLERLRGGHVRFEMQKQAVAIDYFPIPSDYVCFASTLWDIERYYFYHTWGDISFQNLPYEKWILLHGDE